MLGMRTGRANLILVDLLPKVDFISTVCGTRHKIKPGPNPQSDNIDEDGSTLTTYQHVLETRRYSPPRMVRRGRDVAKKN
ncbi:hypothetical protein Forpi1262_v007267 [Fusarium oxysporum f. sp. raphani]|uniref:Uncharacterized protein n=1 Tax=Fusarium oxysporum f. sp. raphani TaxID=96318 RepID=A0A8J5Q4X5_FUSOX|nr:hypothetical protein Forpi1262_v007267 [Fusarium oxysporum f. sp. raphani]